MKVKMNKFVSLKIRKKEVQRVFKNQLHIIQYLHSLPIIMIAIHLIRIQIAIQKVKLLIRLEPCKI